MSKKEELVMCFENAFISKASWVAVSILNEANGAREAIVIPQESFTHKMEYYKEAYTDDLILKTFGKVRITGFEFGFFLNEVNIGMIL